MGRIFWVWEGYILGFKIVLFPVEEPLIVVSRKATTNASLQHSWEDAKPGFKAS